MPTEKVRRCPLSTSQTTTTEHHPALAHQFDSMEQQQDASTFGMWVFLLTEIMMFGGLFTAYLIYRIKFYPAFVAGSTSISVSWGFANTLVLIGSSFTMAMAVWAAQKGMRKAQVWFLLGTMVLGAAFLGVKAKEYYDKWDECHIPGPCHRQRFQYLGRLQRHESKLGNIAEEIRTRRRESKHSRGRRQADRQADRDLLLLLLCHDRPARVPHGHWPGTAYVAAAAREARRVRPTILTRRWNWAGCTGTLSILCGFSCSRCCI